MIRRRTLTAGLLAAGAAAAIRPVRADTVLKVGGTPTGVPFTFLDTKTNTIQGIMVDLVQAVGTRAGFTAEITPMQFSTLIAALTAGEIDAISAAMYITPKREEVVDFSTPVYSYGEGLFVPAGDGKDYRSFEDMKGMTVGAQIGTVYIEPLKKSGMFPEVKVYDSIPDIMRDVNAGRLAAGFADYPIVAYNLKLGMFPSVRLVRSYKSVVVGSIGIAVRKDEGELLMHINQALGTMKQDGTIDKILAHWGL